MKKIPFGHHIYEFHCDPSLTEASLKRVLESKVLWKSTISGNSSSIEFGYMDENHTVPYYDEELFVWLQSCIDQVVEDQMPGLNIEICDSWLIKSDFLQAQRNMHTHGHSVISGIFYYTSHEKTKTIFHKKNIFSAILEQMFNFSNSNNISPTYMSKKETVESVSEAGKLLIFPSNFLHSISAHLDKTTRYVLAFNAFPTGRVATDIPTGRLTLNVKSSREQYLEFMKNQDLDNKDKK